MAMKVKAVEKLLKFDKNSAGVYRYVMAPELYTALSQKKVIKEAALRSGVSQGVMQACWDAAGEVIKAWATEGHSVAPAVATHPPMILRLMIHPRMIRQRTIRPLTMVKEIKS